MVVFQIIVAVFSTISKPRSPTTSLLGTTVEKFTEIAGAEGLEFHNLKENGPLMVRAKDLTRIERKYK